MGVTRQTEVWTRWLRPDRSRRHCPASSSNSALGRMRRPTATTVSAATSEGAAQFLVQPHGLERRLGLGAREPRRAGARQLALVGHLVDIGGLQRIGLDARLIDQGQPARRTGSENEFGPADHGFADSILCGRWLARIRWRRDGATRIGIAVISQPGTRPRTGARHRHSLPRGLSPKRSRIRFISMSRTCAVGVEPLLAVAVGTARIGRRPIFDIGGQRPRQVQRLVMRLGRQRDDEVEIQPVPLLQLLEGIAAMCLPISSPISSIAAIAKGRARPPSRRPSRHRCVLP